MDSENLIGTAPDMRLARIADSAPRTALASVLNREIDDPSIEAILTQFEQCLDQFLYRASDTAGFFLNHPSVSEHRVIAALSTLNSFAKSLDCLNAIERRVVGQLIHRKLNPKNSSSGVAMRSVTEVLEVSSKSAFTKSQISRPATIIRRGTSGVPTDPAYQKLAEAVVAIWRSQGIALNRSKKKHGMLHLTRLLLNCFDAQVTVFAKFDRAGNASPAEDRRLVSRIDVSDISKSLLARLEAIVKQNGCGKT